MEVEELLANLIEEVANNKMVEAMANVVDMMDGHRARLA